MFGNIFKSLIFMVAIFGLLFTVSCAKKDLKTADVPKEEKSIVAAPAAPIASSQKSSDIEEANLYGKTLEEARVNFMNENIYFDFDSSVISPKYIDIMKKKIQWLTTHPDIAMTIEGNCDERGTEAYNLSLGDRRAESIKKFLIDSGINSNRIGTVSYGEERPVDKGHSEEAWAKNRRAHFVLK